MIPIQSALDLKSALELYVALEKETDHVAAMTLAFKLAGYIPGLIQQIERLNESVASNIRHVICTCEWCGKEFKVFHSEMKAGKKSGKFCSRACLDETRKEARDGRGQETKK